MDILNAIGNTSMVQLRKVVPAGSGSIFVKLEWENPTGSMKDRMAHAVISIGGEIEDGETIEEAAYRELFEETGLTKCEVRLGNVVWFGSVDLVIDNELVQVNQRFILAHSSSNKVTLDSLTEDEKETVSRLEWFSLDELRHTTDVIYPANLCVHLSEIANGNIPEKPIEIDLMAPE